MRDPVLVGCFLRFVGYRPVHIGRLRDIGNAVVNSHWLLSVSEARCGVGSTLGGTRLWYAEQVVPDTCRDGFRAWSAALARHPTLARAGESRRAISWLSCEVNVMCIPAIKPPAGVVPVAAERVLTEMAAADFSACPMVDESAVPRPAPVSRTVPVLWSSMPSMLCGFPERERCRRSVPPAPLASDLLRLLNGMSVLARFGGGPTALTGSIESHVGKWAEHSLIDAFLSSSGERDLNAEMNGGTVRW
jgi:hypothetical protein